MKKIFLMLLFFTGLGLSSVAAQEASVIDAAASDEVRAAIADSGFDNTIFDDEKLIKGYALKIGTAQKDFLLAMINDDSLAAYRKAASVRVFSEKFASQIVSQERAIVERVLLRQLERAASPFVQVEIMHALLLMNRYRYFDSMVPALIQKMDHYDLAVNNWAYESIVHVNEQGNQRSREARIVFNTLRKMFFLTRKKLANADPAEPRLRNKLDLLRWSIKVLGTAQLELLPKEVIGLM